MRWLPRAISIVVIAVVLVAVMALIYSKMPATKVGQHFTAWALFRDGSRLAVGSPVEIAGVHVGEISKLSVQGDFARVDLLLRDDLDVPVDSWITKRAESAFGDSYLEIIPTVGEEGAPSARRLRPGDRIVHVEEGGSTDTVLRAIARTMPKIDQGLDTVHDFALDGRKWTNSTLEPAIVNADHWLAEGHIDKPIEAADRAMVRVEDGTTRAADAVTRARPDFMSGLDRFDMRVIKLRGQIADAKQGLREGFANARQGMDRVDQPIQDLADITQAIDEGRGEDWKGTLGRLVNDPKLAERIDEFTEDTREVVANFTRLKSWLGLRAEENIFAHEPRVYLTAEIRARNDKFYLIEIEKGPLGSIPQDQLSDVLNAPQYNRYQEISDSIRYTAQFGKTFFNHLQLRGGIKESTIGFGADVLLNEGKLRFESDLFGSFYRTPRLKLAASLAVFRSIYILGGVDDVLNPPGSLRIVAGQTPVPQQFDTLRYGRDYFLGATLHFDDADLSTIIRVYGAMIVGLLH